MQNLENLAMQSYFHRFYAELMKFSNLRKLPDEPIEHVSVPMEVEYMGGCALVLDSKHRPLQLELPQASRARENSGRARQPCADRKQSSPTSLPLDARLRFARVFKANQYFTTILQ